jgi:Flp pilus assembly protein TadG
VPITDNERDAPPEMERVMRPFRRRRGDRSERGAVAVEMAIVTPLLVLLIFGIIEFGLFFRESLTIASAVTSAARTGATMGTRAEADLAILQALEAGLYDQVDTSVIISVEIFEANPVTGDRTGFYDRYEYVPTNVTCKWFPCPDPDVDGAVGSWTPDVRDTTLKPGGGGLDVLGIELTYHHSTITKMIPVIDGDFTERALVRLEPALFGSSDD